MNEDRPGIFLPGNVPGGLGPQGCVDGDALERKVACPHGVAARELHGEIDGGSRNQFAFLHDEASSDAPTGEPLRGPNLAPPTAPPQSPTGSASDAAGIVARRFQDYGA